jgi:hypothetical protein
MSLVIIQKTLLVIVMSCHSDGCDSHSNGHNDNDDYDYHLQGMHVQKIAYNFSECFIVLIALYEV